MNLYEKISENIKTCRYNLLAAYAKDIQEIVRNCAVLGP